MGDRPRRARRVAARSRADRTLVHCERGLLLIHVTTVPLTLGFLRGQAEFLRARGIQSEAISSPGTLLDRFEELEGAPTHAVRMERRITPVRDLIAVFRLWWLLVRRRPLIVHSHTPKGGLLGMIAAFLARVPARVFHMRGLPLVTAHGAQRRILVASERLSCRLAHQVLCVSRSLRDVALDEALTVPDKIRVLGEGSSNGVDARSRFNPRRVGAEARQQVRERWEIGDRARVVGFVGRLVKDKGVADLAAAWKILRGRHEDLHLLLVGPEESRDAAPHEVLAALRADQRVHFAGLVEDMPAHYAAMDVIAFPSYREGFPNVPLEAAAMELPVVATRVTGNVDAIVDGVTGSLVEVGAPEALADAVATYLDDPERAQRHGVAARARVLADFDPVRIWRELFEVYVELLDKRGLLPSGVPIGDPAETAWTEEQGRRS